MSNIVNMNICHDNAFDDMDLGEPSYSYEDFLDAEPVKYAFNEEEEEVAAEARRISTGSADSNDTTANTATPIHINIYAKPIHVVTSDQFSDIFDDYEVLPDILGSGHYGQVRECQHRATGEKYAVKTIEKCKVARLDHIRREVELLRSVDHCGIMKMVDCFEDADYVHIVTERYTGGELFDEIVNNTTECGCLDEVQAAKIIKSLLESVQYLHSKNIVHRDIKPENVLFESNEEGSSIKLIDFGLARTYDKVKQGWMTNPVGTPYYMSPGVLTQKYDKSCDVWSIGIISYILLAGYPPFNGSTDYEVQDSILNAQLVFERVVWGNLSTSCRHFVSMILNKDSKKRSITADEALHHPWIASA